MGAILHILLDVLRFILDLLLLPINALITATMPDFSAYINLFYSFLDSYVTPLFSYFFSILPPYTRGLVAFYLLLLISLYTITISVHFAIKFFYVIKKVKFW